MQTNRARRLLGAVVLGVGLTLTGCGTQSGTAPAEPAAPSPPGADPSEPWFKVRADELATGAPSSPGATPELPFGYELKPRPGESLPPPPADCADGEGMLVRAGMVEAATGLRALGLRLVNCGDTPHTVDGYPDVRVLDDERQPLDVAVHDGPRAVTGGDEPGPRPVTLRPGEEARAAVYWRNTYDDTTRLPVHGTHLDVAPAPGDPWQTVTPDGGLDLGSTGKLALSPWKPAA
ncbi:DUF4232 domain-containing protein [Streptomyces sp. TRM 70351]|uniref:DUF4232 domain-containing protein n=1 Tax=Streptomyces sp. TRM 70351 TaxID=3116552 RepID=UPI002E7AECAC|nr:DUF4232 domain-containing protein [Streptomyces sp. TRM 70351]MEE1930211.1 DUF4232 domain-containing protein [Streptomyces sp. TRM 70351]